jgi:hypothetical protein
MYIRAALFMRFPLILFSVFRVPQSAARILRRASRL